jgi:hypothetical protein
MEICRLTACRGAELAPLAYRLMAWFADPLTGLGLGLQMPVPVLGGARAGMRSPIGSGVTIIVWAPKPATDVGCCPCTTVAGTCGITGRGAWRGRKMRNACTPAGLVGK